MMRRAFAFIALIAMISLSDNLHAQGTLTIGCKTRTALDELIRTYNATNLSAKEIARQMPRDPDGTRPCMYAPFEFEDNEEVLEKSVRMGDDTVSILTVTVTGVWIGPVKLSQRPHQRFILRNR